MDEGGKSGRQRLIVRVGAALTLFALIMVAPTSWLVFAFNHEFRQCVPLGNGLWLGYESVIDLGETLFYPKVVLKYRDGTPLIRAELWSFEATQTSVFGVTDAREPRDMFAFAWRADTGLVLAFANPPLYERIVAEAKAVISHGGADDIDEGDLYYQLNGGPGPKTERCPTALVTW